MAQISASEVSKLRKTTGAGMMDCKNALQEAEGDFDKAIDILRKKGQKLANKRADREASEGVVLAKTTEDGKKGIILVLNCETDFVAKNEDFIAFADKIANKALEETPADLEGLKILTLDSNTIGNIVTEQVGVIGEKLELSYFDKIEAESVTAYIHPGNKLATLVGLNKGGLDAQVGKDVAMQVAAMSPVSVDKDDVPQEVIDKELEIGKELALKEGKPENIVEKIALGKLNKFFKENTLLNQDFIKDSKTTVKQYLQGIDKELDVTSFKRFTLNI
ncbi:translation elongation factor Ts [Bacteroidota bacterium]